MTKKRTYKKFYRLLKPSSNLVLISSSSTIIRITKSPLFLIIKSSFSTATHIHFLGFTFSLIVDLTFSISAPSLTLSKTTECAIEPTAVSEANASVYSISLLPK